MKIDKKEFLFWNPVKGCLESKERAFTNESNSSTKVSTVWMNSNEAALYLKVSVPQLFNLTSTGSLPYYKLGRSNRYKKCELDKYLESKMRGIRDDS